MTEGADGNLLPPVVGGPNVCRSASASGAATFCCPGWRQRGLTGLCLAPVCSRGCGEGGVGGRCIKPNLCLCAGGRIMPRCQEGDAGEDGVSPDICQASHQ